MCRLWFYACTYHCVVCLFSERGCSPGCHFPFIIGSGLRTVDPFLAILAHRKPLSRRTHYASQMPPLAIKDMVSPPTSIPCRTRYLFSNAKRLAAGATGRFGTPCNSSLDCDTKHKHERRRHRSQRHQLCIRSRRNRFNNKVTSTTTRDGKHLVLTTTLRTAST